MQSYYGDNSKTEFFGLSTETKPIAGVRVGERFKEVDTGKPFMFNGTEWIDDPFPNGGGSGTTGSTNWVSTQW